MYRPALCMAILAFAFLCAASPGQDGKKKSQKRYGFEVDEITYPQKTPAEAMKSIGLALERKRVDYLLAQMADPAHVDFWVDQYKMEFTQGKEEGRRLLAFDRLVRETVLYFDNDPLIVKELRVFARDAKWTEEGETAVGVVESIPARKVFLKKVGERWFLENKQQ